MGREHWVKAILQDVSEIVTGNTPPKNNSTFYGNKYPWIKPDELDIKDAVNLYLSKINDLCSNIKCIIYNTKESGLTEQEKEIILHHFK